MGTHTSGWSSSSLIGRCYIIPTLHLPRCTCGGTRRCRTHDCALWQKGRRLGDLSAIFAARNKRGEPPQMMPSSHKNSYKPEKKKDFKLGCTSLLIGNSQRFPQWVDVDAADPISSISEDFVDSFTISSKKHKLCFCWFFFFTLSLNLVH